MFLLEIDIQSRIIFGITAMVALFASFMIALVNNHRKKMQYHKNLQTLHEEQKQILTNQNQLLEQRVKERTSALNQQKEVLQQSLEELRFAQSQLVQREKMASLGELTAGIAHEIQNPLNFVNNFSEINSELLSEIKDQLAKETLSEIGKKQIQGLTHDLSQNLEKINHHGKRADAIVKGMLQHSRGGAAQRELTDINALCEEYLRLSYHGFRARDKTFNAGFETNFDASLGKVDVVPQDLSRVLLNIFNNAFYSVSERKKKGGSDYQPTVRVSTRKSPDRIIITIRDNGLGVPDTLKDKIFQPFFTTKPAGQGTGLGLSLSYDIIKAAGGEIKINSKAGDFAEFSIYLPLV
jgi:C4-dicarboxylate-specific signal transduction histidine kinase